MPYDYKPYPYSKPAELNGGSTSAPVAIVGAGPIGLALAIDLAQRGVASVVLDDDNTVSLGSRAICWAKRTLEIMDRLGIGERMLAKGVTWKVGRQFHGDDEVYAFDLLPEDGHKYPAFVNLQQYYVEEYLVDRVRDFPELIDLRFLNKVTGHTDTGSSVIVQVETSDGPYNLEAEYLIACDGAGSPTRKRMGLDFTGQTFAEQFLIADIEMEQSPFDQGTPERWFWFDPTFHPGKSALLHEQPDNIYRIDLQLDVAADGKAEATEEKVIPRIKAMVGDKPFRLDWMSVYRFRCMKLDQFIHGRVIFAGDSAHVVSPFGARGGNGGIQDVDNLGWKLAAVLGGTAGPGLLNSYETERGHGAEENILNSSRATNFMTPKTPIEALFRGEVLRLAKTQDFARKLINSGRLSRPCSLEGSELQSGQGPLVGQAALDAPLTEGWVIDRLQGEFTLVSFGDCALPEVGGLSRLHIGAQVRDYAQVTPKGGDAEVRYGHYAAYLFRPDAHIAAAWQEPPSARDVQDALTHALGGKP